MNHIPMKLKNESKLSKNTLQTMATLNTGLPPSWHIQLGQAQIMNTGLHSQSPATGQCASDLWHKGPTLLHARRAFSELRYELDNLDMPNKRLRLDQLLSGSISVARTVPPAAPNVCKSLPTIFNWDRTNAQNGGLLDWSMDELQDHWQFEVQAAARAVRGKLTRDQAVVIFVARRYVPFPRLSFFSQAAAVSSCQPCACQNEGASDTCVLRDDVYRSYPGPTVATMLATEFQVTSKAIRDIWSHKTWVRDTAPFWNLALDGMPQPDFKVASPALAAASARVTAALGSLIQDRATFVYLYSSLYNMQKRASFAKAWYMYQDFAHRSGAHRETRHKILLVYYIPWPRRRAV